MDLVKLHSTQTYIQYIYIFFFFFVFLLNHCFVKNLSQIVKAPELLYENDYVQITFCKCGSQ